MNDVLEVIDKRRSVRAYKDIPVDDEQLKILIDAALKAPSARNSQPCHFCFVRNKKLLKEFADDFAALDIEKYKDYNVLYAAPLTCFIFIEKPGTFSQADLGIACENIVLAAQSIGLSSVILGMPKAVFDGNNGAKWYEKLNAPDKSEFLLAVSIGYAACEKAAHTIRDGLVSVID